MPILQIHELVKTYREFSLGPLSLTVDKGCALGLVGANGAGKTTLFRSLMGTVRRQQGEVAVKGATADGDGGQWKQSVGYVGDFIPLFDGWTGYRNLAARAGFYPDWSEQRAQELARRLNLDLSRRVKDYSTGQRTKLGIVQALCHRPGLLLLDEPTAGLDPVSRDAFMELLFEVMEDGERSLIYATHHIGEIEQLADRLVFISGGLVIRDEIKEDLIASWRRISFRCEQALDPIPHALRHKSDHPYHELISDDAPATLGFLNERGIDNIEASRLSIDQIAIEILKQSAREFSHV